MTGDDLLFRYIRDGSDTVPTVALREAAAEIERLRRVLDVVRIWMKNHDRSEREQVLYDEVRRALEGTSPDRDTA